MFAIKIYRIENPQTKCGMWYNERGQYEPFVDKLTEGRSKHLPMPHDDSFRKNNLKWYSACRSIDQLIEWFSERDIYELVENGYRIYALEVSQYKIEENQVLYTKEGILTKTELEPEELRLEEVLEENAEIKNLVEGSF